MILSLYRGFTTAVSPAAKAYLARRANAGKEDPARIPTAIEEFLRYDSPVQGLGRTTTAPVQLHGVTIPEGSRVLLLERQ